jgi:dihydroxy-acid dehydratase
VPNRKLHLDVSQAEIKRRLTAWKSPVEAPAGGYTKLYHDHVTGADTGADFDFLKGCRGNAVPKDSH